MATAPAPFPTFPSVTPPPPFCFGAPPYAPYPFPYPNQPPPPSPSYHAAAYHHHHRFQLPPPSHLNPHWHQGMQQMQPPSGLLCGPPSDEQPPELRLELVPAAIRPRRPPPSSPPPLAASMAAVAPAWPLSSSTKEVRKYLAYDDDTASVHSTVNQNPSSPLAPSYDSTCRQPGDYQQGASSDSYAHKVFEPMPSLQGRVLIVKLHHKVSPISIETLHRIFLSCGIVEKMIYTAHMHSPRLFIQYQNDQMATQAMWVLQGKCIPETYCQLEVQLAQGSDLHTFQDYSCEMDFQSGPGGYNVGHNINESLGEEEHEREIVRQIISSVPGPNTDGFDTMDHKAHTVDRRLSILNMLAPIQAKLHNISENLGRDLKRRGSRVSKQHAAPQLKPSTQHAINVTDAKPLDGVYAEEDNGSSIGLCTVLHTNLIIQQDVPNVPNEVPVYDLYGDEQQENDNEQPICGLEKQNGAENLSFAKQDKEQLLNCSSKNSDTGHAINFFPWDPGAAAILVTPLNLACVAAHKWHI